MKAICQAKHVIQLIIGKENYFTSGLVRDTSSYKIEVLQLRINIKIYRGDSSFSNTTRC
jgi:hypothetical protein